MSTPAIGNPAVEQRAANDKKRLLKVTPGNLSQSHIYVTGHYDFFPLDCIGPSRKSGNGDATPIEILLDGLNETVQTDIGRNAKTGKPRSFFRGRTWVRRFFEHHRINAGDRDLRESHA